MNDEVEPFENRLKSQTPRQIPAEWRAEILAAARLPEKASPPPEEIPFWRLIFARFPVATGALAAVWIGLIAINFFLFGGEHSTAPRAEAGASESMTAWNLQLAELRKLADGTSPSAKAFPDVPPAILPTGPRSERRRENGLGEIQSEWSSELFA